MNIFVTGSDGYIGTILCSFLMDKGHHIVGFDTGYYKESYLYDDLIKKPKTITKDIREIVSNDLKGIDTVIHLAELSNDPLGQIRPAVTNDINYEGSKRLAYTSKKTGIKQFIYISSCSVYGIAQEEIVTEDFPTNPQTEYAKCKILVEQILTDMADDNFSPTILRNATVYGYSPRMRFDTVLNNLTGMAWTDKKITIKSDGSPWRPLIHIQDVCEGINCILNSPREFTHNEIFNLGDTKENYQIKDLAASIANIISDCNIVIKPIENDSRSYRVSFNKINEQLNYKCERSVMDGIKELKHLFDKIRLTKEEFLSPAFTRIKQIEHLINTKRIDSGFYWAK